MLKIAGMAKLMTLTIEKANKMHVCPGIIKKQRQAEMMTKTNTIGLSIQSISTYPLGYIF